MRPLILLIAVACSGYIVGCGSSDAETGGQPLIYWSQDLRPPAISEHFTLLPCPAKPKTTVDLEACAAHRARRLDGAIDQRVRVIFSLLRSRRSPAATVRFVRAERAWLTYRRSVCASRADVYEGGSGEELLFTDCVADSNVAHLTGLRAFERDLRR
jgi:uncharacterized protein YecT (DUF1311 family)